MPTPADLDTNGTIQQYAQFVLNNYARTPIVVVRGEGSRFWDAEGKEYLDLFPGWGVNILGYCHPHVVRAVQDQVARLMHVDNTLHTREQGRLAQMLIERLGYDARAFFCNSGAEANEGAIKMARRFHWHQAQKAGATGQPPYKVITHEKSFHGRTYAAMSATAQSKIHQGFGPLVPGFVYVPRGDVKALADAIDEHTAAILFEPIQGEGGVNLPPENYMHAVRTLCDEHGLVLIFDEVQCGSARTGKWYSHDHFGVQPDIVTLAKGIGAGVPLGAILAKPHIAEGMTPGTHGTTYGGSPLVVSAAIATIEAIERDNLLHTGAAVGDHIRARFRELAERNPIVTDVRGLGMMIGVQLAGSGVEIVKQCLARGVRLNCTQDTVLRMLPALTLTVEEADAALAVIFDCIEQAYPAAKVEPAATLF